MDGNEASTEVKEHCEGVHGIIQQATYVDCIISQLKETEKKWKDLIAVILDVSPQKNRLCFKSSCVEDQ